MFNLDNSSAGLDRSSLQRDRRGNKPMAARRLKTGQGFSLFDLKDVISDVTETLATALNKQGVDVSTDNLFLQLQNLVQSVGSSNGYVDPGMSYSGVLSASDKVPYSMAGDLIVIAYENFKNGDRKEALKNMIAAMGTDDFAAIANGIFLMNKKNDSNMVADDSDNEEDNTSDTDTDSNLEDTSDDDDLEDSDPNSEDSDDDDTDEDTGDDDLEDSDIDKALNDADSTGDAESTASDDDEGDNNTDSSSEDNSKEDSDPVKTPEENEDPNRKPKPMGKTSSEMTASHTSKVLANKLSLDGSPISRARALEFLKKNKNL